MSPFELIGKNIRAARRQAHLAQIDLAEMVGINRAYLSEIENGRRNMTIGILMAVADALKIRLSDILSGIE
ncbi:MAG: helix-turn-helix transcriptional regulator [Alphaproteobacteria bacterium]|nr:helix-turn-helix transcriptional regulator [Alphaproteobacteria bacterium]